MHNLRKKCEKRENRERKENKTLSVWHKQEGEMLHSLKKKSSKKRKKKKNRNKREKRKTKLSGWHKQERKGMYTSKKNNKILVSLSFKASIKKNMKSHKRIWKKRKIEERER